MIFWRKKNENEVGNDDNEVEFDAVPLNDFVKVAILQSLHAIKSAQEDKDVGALVAPTISGEAKIDPSYGVAYHDGKMFTTMSFDLAVTAETNAKKALEGEAKGGIPSLGWFPSIKLGGSVEGSKRNQNENRIKFAVHVELPQKDV